MNVRLDQFAVPSASSRTAPVAPAVELEMVLPVNVTSPGSICPHPSNRLFVTSCPVASALFENRMPLPSAENVQPSKTSVSMFPPEQSMETNGPPVVIVEFESENELVAPELPSTFRKYLSLAISHASKTI